jgi:hypothetical protein
MGQQRSCSPTMHGALTLLLAQTPAVSEPLAELDGEAITAEEVEKAIAAQLSKLEEQIYDLKRQKLEALIAERLLAREAAKRGMTVQALLDAEVTTKVALVTEPEIETFYQANKAQLKGDEATVREQIRSYLQKQKPAARREAVVQALRSQATVVVHLQTPPVFRADVNVHRVRFKGLTTAPVTIVEVSDFLSLPLQPAGAADARPARIAIRRQGEARVPGLSDRQPPLRGAESARGGPVRR